MLKSKSSDETESCTLCNKNSEQLKRYEQLIRLYRKKERQHSSEGSRNSQLGTSQNSTLLPSQIASHKILQVLQILIHRRCSSFFALANRASSKKFVVLSLCNRMGKSLLKAGFDSIAEVCSPRRPLQSLVETLWEIRSNSLRAGLKAIKSRSGLSVVQEQIVDNLVDKQGAWEETMDSLARLQPRVEFPAAGHSLRRRNMELAILNNKLCLENKYLRTCLEEASRRQAKENQKKRESLEMLAEQLIEKNEQIAELQSSLRFYEEKYGTSGNVLEDEMMCVKKELESMESLKDRFEHECIKANDKLEKNNAALQTLSLEIEALRRENNTLREQNFGNQQRLQAAQKSTTELQGIRKIYQRKLKRLTTYEKAMEAGRESASTAAGIVQETKTELVLCYLANITASDYQLHGQELFEKEEIEFLGEHKAEYLRNKKEAEDFIKKNDKKEVDFDFTGMEMGLKGAGGPSESIFCALESPRQEKSSITLKMLELELENKKKVEKISELKEKQMHIRMIVLGLLKALEIQTPAKPETEGILHVLFEMFEYSEEERESIFTKKKKFFGFI